MTTTDKVTRLEKLCEVLRTRVTGVVSIIEFPDDSPTQQCIIQVSNSGIRWCWQMTGGLLHEFLHGRITMDHVVNRIISDYRFFLDTWFIKYPDA